MKACCPIAALWRNRGFAIAAIFSLGFGALLAGTLLMTEETCCGPSACPATGTLSQVSECKSFHAGVRQEASRRAAISDLAP